MLLQNQRVSYSECCSIVACSRTLAINWGDVVGNADHPIL